MGTLQVELLSREGEGNRTPSERWTVLIMAPCGPRQKSISNTNKHTWSWIIASLVLFFCSQFAYSPLLQWVSFQSFFTFLLFFCVRWGGTTITLTILDGKLYTTTYSPQNNSYWLQPYQPQTLKTPLWVWKALNILLTEAGKISYRIDKEVIESNFHTDEVTTSKIISFLNQKERVNILFSIVFL